MEDISTHSFRRGYAQHLLEKDVDIRQIQVQLGHSNIATTQRYLESNIDVKQLEKVWEEAVDE